MRVVAQVISLVLQMALAIDLAAAPKVVINLAQWMAPVTVLVAAWVVVKVVIKHEDALSEGVSSIIIKKLLKSQSPTDQTFLLNARIEKLQKVIVRLEKSLQEPFYSNIEHTFYKLRLEETIQMNKQLLSKYKKELLAD
jgi:uncharacterized protein (DUF1015 family)